MDPSVTVEEEISVPGLVGGPVTATAPSAKQNEDEEVVVTGLAVSISCDLVWWCV